MYERTAAWSVTIDAPLHPANSEQPSWVAETVRLLPQITAWAYERANGGRGFGFTGGHFHANWQEENATNLVVNAIVWSTGN